MYLPTDKDFYSSIVFTRFNLFTYLFANLFAHYEELILKPAGIEPLP